MLDQLLTRGHVASWVHRVNGAALGVIVGELGQSSLLEIAVELVGVNQTVHRIVLHPLLLLDLY